MSDKQVSNGLKSALEFGPVALFFIAYIWLKDEVFQFDGSLGDLYPDGSSIFPVNTPTPSTHEVASGRDRF